ncbi:type VI secretion system-associated protein TagO [Paracoccus onubensis]|uniref:type VI secretion system-associated protein TagO n=1 Tax=Paracoccus onubensis TaxID=1675788 RepID=UPI002731A328|nr:type VI secretion system-associated protein TagO [Paracoccus onubensis]MDP0928999.1 type VI secretion system-associated protein TagO [Paracoccus onubensis]
MRRILAVPFLLLPAQAISQDVSKCLEIHDNFERWSCYDDTAGYVAPEKETAELEGRSTLDNVNENNWRTQTEKSEFEDTQDIYLSVQSEGTLMCNDFGPSQKASLWIRCLENTTAIFIDTSCHLASGFHGYGKVDIRIDEEDAFSRDFNASTDNRALGLWSGGQSIPIVKRLFGKDTLRMRFTPFNKSPVSAEFKISGLEEKIVSLRESCGW